MVSQVNCCQNECRHTKGVLARSSKLRVVVVPKVRACAVDHLKLLSFSGLVIRNGSA